MRYCSFSAVRNFTLFTLVVLSSHSFVLAQDEPGTGSIAPSLPLSPASPSPSPTPSSSSSPSPPPSTAPPPPPVSHSSSSSTPLSAPPTHSSNVPGTSSQPSKSSSGDLSQSSSGSSTSSQSQSSSSASASSVSSTASSSSLASVPPGTFVAPPPTNTYYSQYSYTAHLESPSAAAPSETPIGAASSSGASFSHNKGAIAAVATIASLIGISVIAYLTFKILKRRARLRDEEEEVYFEKYQEQDPPFQGTGPSDSSYNIDSAMQPAATSAYPDRSMHYGTNDAVYADPQQYGMHYPPGTAYAAAAYGEQYQYQGDNSNYGAAASTGSHPYARPENTSRPAAAPPVTRGYDHSQEIVETGYAA
ncbi:hypothetical protein BDW22DRAFT_1341780 [Trametopsis cervina]|nr:hypothetical protein BDW22DRAFT_1341780 [Trametopsis cervina]